MENQQSQDQAPNMEMPTPEQIAIREAQRKAMIEFYKKDLPNMKIEAAYNELQLRIEKARFETWQWRIRFDQMMAPPPDQNEGKDQQGTDKMSPEANATFQAAVDTTKKEDTGNVIPLNTVTKTEEAPQN